MVKGWQENRREMYCIKKKKKKEQKYFCGKSFLEYGNWNKHVATCSFVLYGLHSASISKVTAVSHVINFLFFPSFFPINFLFFPLIFFSFLLFPVYFLFSLPFSLLICPIYHSLLFNVWMTPGALGCCYCAWCTKLSTRHLCCWHLAQQNCSSSISW